MDKTIPERIAMERTAERRREKHDILEVEKTLSTKSRSATPMSHITDPATHSLSSVDEEDEEEGPTRGSGRTGTASGSCADGGVCKEEEEEGAGGCGEMPPAVAAQREFLARLQAKEQRRQCCRRCCDCCMPCCTGCCKCCLRCCRWPPWPKSKRCWNPCRYSSYFYAALVLACAICGAVFLSCGAVQNNRQFLIAGSILCITSFGLFLHRCFRKSPYQPKGYPGFMDEDDFSSCGSGGYATPPPIPPPEACGEEGDKNNTLSPPSGGTSTIPVYCNGRRPSGFDPTVRRASIYDVSQRRRSSMFDGGRRSSTAHSLGCVGGDPSRYYRRQSRSGASGILDLARRLSVAGGPFNDGWNHSGHLRHHYRRSCSYPWAMARPERHYVEYV